MKEDRSEQAINTRLRELAEEARNIRRDLEQGRSPRVPRSAPVGGRSAAAGQKKDRIRRYGIQITQRPLNVLAEVAPSRRLKIVHISTTASGAPWMVALMREQKRLGHDVSAIVTGLTPDVIPVLDDPTIQFHRCQAALLSLRGIGARMRALLALARLLRRLRPDVVHSHVLEAVVASRLASWIADVPRHFGGNVAPISVESPLLRPLELGTAFCDAVTIASCTHTRDLFLQHGIPAQKVALIHYAVDQSRHDPASADGDRVRRELGIRSTRPSSARWRTSILQRPLPCFHSGRGGV